MLIDIVNGTLVLVRLVACRVLCSGSWQQLPAYEPAVLRRSNGKATGQARPWSPSWHTVGLVHHTRSSLAPPVILRFAGDAGDASRAAFSSAVAPVQVVRSPETVRCAGVDAIRQAGIRCRGAGNACFHLAVVGARIHETVVIVKTGQYGSVARPRRAMLPRVVSALVVERAWWCGHQRASALWLSVDEELSA